MYRLLIVDDEPDICENVKYLLDWAGYGFTSIMTAVSFPDALSKAVDLQPHVALVDIRLGDRWGYDLVAQLHATGMRTVFCMISGYDDSRYIRRAMQASAGTICSSPWMLGNCGPLWSAPSSTTWAGRCRSGTWSSRSWTRS